jgi:hypothetical protein
MEERMDKETNVNSNLCMEEQNKQFSGVLFPRGTSFVLTVLFFFYNTPFWRNGLVWG